MIRTSFRTTLFRNHRCTKEQNENKGNNTEHQQIEYSNEIRESSRKALNQSKLGLCSTEKCPQRENTFRILFECSARALVHHVHGALRALILAHVATCTSSYCSRSCKCTCTRHSRTGLLDAFFFPLSRTVKRLVKCAFCFISRSWNRGFFHQLPAPRYMPPAPSNPAGVASASASMVSSPQGEGNSKCAKYLRFDLTMDLILLRQCWAHPQLFVRGSPDMQGQGIAEELGRDPPFQGVSKRDPIANSLNRMKHPPLRVILNGNEKQQQLRSVQVTFSELKEEKRIQQIDLLCNKRSHCTSQNPSPQLLRLENSIRKYWSALHAEPLFHSNFRSDFLFAIRIIKSKIRFADAP